ncbi:Aminopeptidase YwaD precursor [Rubripirellula tenax]|uniref:Aminopeptidase YwaD n=1 Tax=Rubripirellula tenax TaxID=2528015 RepID=A0A5C6FJQ7_9BACT|nr:M28 family peptidase [Rubripirellula tenax]TWU60279.1 Aminopeptidase YwaD precursor [Rubripirellula tenax]
MNGFFASCMAAPLTMIGLIFASDWGTESAIGQELLSTVEAPTELDPAAQRLELLRADIAYLSSEELRGRSVADDTILLAADYVADRMTKIGLDTTVMDGTPFQPVSIPLGAEAGAADANRLVIRVGEADEALIAGLNDGLSPMAVGSTTGQLTGPIAFVGYGITAPRLNYDDYAGVDVRGATVIVIRKEPQMADPNSPFDGTRNSRHAFFATKIKNAINHGASAMIIVNDPVSIAQNVKDQKNRIKAERGRIQSIQEQLDALPAEAVNNRDTLQTKIEGVELMIESMTEELASIGRGVLGIADAGERTETDAAGGAITSIPVVSVARDTIDRLLSRTTGRSLAEMETAIDDDLTPQSRRLPGVSATLAVELKSSNRESPNVIGVIDGHGELANETVVIGAHYDHVGMGGVGSLAPGTIAVHNGADDNASGTATLLATAGEMVRRLAMIDSHRRIVFIAFTGEERGLLGSKYYVRHPRFSLESTVAMINLDMVGRVRDNELTVYGTGTADVIDEIVEGANRETKFDLFKVASGYGPSDHQSFYEVGIPVLFFFTGLHNDYHRPSDDFDKIDFGGMTRITDITSNSLFELAIRGARPRYAATDRSVQIRRQMTAFLGVSLSDRGDQVTISGVTAGGPAEQGGFRIGDRLISIAGKRIFRTSDVLARLRDLSPGDEAKIEFVREGRVMVLKPRLAARPEG